MNIAVSLIAGLASFLISFKVPRGTLGLWCVLLAGLWLSPYAELTPDAKRIVFAVAVLFVSLVFQGRLALYFAMLALGLGFSLPGLSDDFNRQELSRLLRSDSFLFLEFGLACGVSLLFARVARARSEKFRSSLTRSSSEIEKARARIGAAQDALQAAREGLLGRSLAEGESLVLEGGSASFESPELVTASFDEMIATLRKSFADFQLRGRTNERIAGPIRFVFFAPVAGYDEKSVIAVDLAALATGLEACLSLALESLPEIGARKREGVIRLSIRYGLRVVEVAVEDNGRGLAARNPVAEDQLHALKDLVRLWGGKFDRLARLGVGSRTSLELRIVRERTRVYRATLRHRMPTASALIEAPSSGPAEGAPLA